MAKTVKRQASADEIALKGKPSWKIATPLAADSAGKVSVDVVGSLELTKLKEKYFGKTESVGLSRKSSVSPPKDSENMTMVSMEPKIASDSHFGRKVVLVHKGKIVGEQG